MFDTPHAAAIEICNRMFDIANEEIDTEFFEREVQVFQNWINQSALEFSKSEFASQNEFSMDNMNAPYILIDFCDSIRDFLHSLKSWAQNYLYEPVDTNLNHFIDFASELKNQFSVCGCDVDTLEFSKDDLAVDYHKIYQVTDILIRESFEAAPEKFQELKIMMKKLAIPMPTTANEAILRNMFKELKSFKVEHSNYEVGFPIGSGSFASVYKGVEISSGRAVAIKALKIQNLKNHEITLLRREIGIMASLKHPNLVNFIGATCEKPLWIVMELCQSNLRYRLQDKNPPSPEQRTIIGYKIAESMDYLHKKHIIHRDLKPENVLMTKDDEPKIADFGIARRVDDDISLHTRGIGTPVYEAPEVGSGKEYSYKADVFSFALILWRLATLDQFFPGMDENQIQFRFQSGERPKMPWDASPDLDHLIQDCWSADPEKRPSFEQIMRRMRRENIGMPGADDEIIKSFYTNCENETAIIRKQSMTSISLIEDNNIPSDMYIIHMLEEDPGSDELNSILINELVSKYGAEDVDEDYPQYLESLRKAGFIGIMIDACLKLKDPNNGALSLITLTDTVALKNELVSCGAVRLIEQLLMPPCLGVIGASKLAMHLNPILDERHLKEIIGPLLLAKQIKAAAQLIEQHPDVNLAKEIEPTLDTIVSTNNKEQTVILTHYSRFGTNARIMAKIVTTPHVISLGSVELARKLCAQEIFAARLCNEDVSEICKAISSPTISNDEKATAITLAISFPTKVLAVLAKHPKFIEDIIRIDDDTESNRKSKTSEPRKKSKNREMAGRLLFKLCQFKEVAGMMLNNTMNTFIYDNAQIPAVFSIMIRVASFFPTSVMKRSWIVEYCIQLMDQKVMLETSLRILGILSTCAAFKESDVPARVEASIGTLVKNGDLSPLQLTLAVGVLYNISAFKPIESAHRQQLVLAESGKGYAGMAFKILSRGKLARPTNATSGRLVDLAESFLEGDDAYGLSGSCAVLKKMAADEGYRKAVGTADMERRLNGAIVRTKRAEIAAELAETLNAFGFRAGAETLAAIDAFLMSPATEAKYADRIQAARAEMRI